ncbi:hypothetical protein Emin_0509 [Elusimicrobium minutum Pei191]|uniref:Uncharacterized protein n=1 Tax=Elusimicrobium minutum (strain Pei191) TaxID=445932 RepID=B2KCE4_ELUMP|nr:hypothetical protein [Elusimicrobium minutum]ACC98065.1 hypothetical protein Emin_0509 [Elusimicrobium minutum Pei191]
MKKIAGLLLVFLLPMVVFAQLTDEQKFYNAKLPYDKKFEDYIKKYHIDEYLETVLLDHNDLLAVAKREGYKQYFFELFKIDSYSIIEKKDIKRYKVNNEYVDTPYKYADFERKYFNITLDKTGGLPRHYKDQIGYAVMHWAYKEMYEISRNYDTTADRTAEYAAYHMAIFYMLQTTYEYEDFLKENNYPIPTFTKAEQDVIEFFLLEKNDIEEDY